MYSFLVSVGRNDDAASILQSLSNQTKDKKQIKDIVVEEISAWLNAQGFITNTHLGQSYFKCQIGVRKKADDEQYYLGILIDTDEQSGDVIEKYFQRPLTMQTFGWKVTQVWIKDWLHKKDDVTKQLLLLLQ